MLLRSAQRICDLSLEATGHWTTAYVSKWGPHVTSKCMDAFHRTRWEGATSWHLGDISRPGYRMARISLHSEVLSVDVRNESHRKGPSASVMP